MCADNSLSGGITAKWHGGGKPSAKTLKAVADYFGTTPKALLAMMVDNQFIDQEVTAIDTNEQITKLEKEKEWLKGIVSSQQETIRKLSGTINNFSENMGKKIGDFSDAIVHK
jgi:hypothetical protein